MIIPNLIAPPSGHGSAPADPAFDYLARVAADSGTVQSANGVIQNVTKFQTPNSMGSNLFDSASIVIDANGGIKTGKVYALKPANGDADLDVVRSSQKWVEAPGGGIIERPINAAPIRWSVARNRWEINPELGATNQVRNNTMQGAVVGTPGVLPTNWQYVNSASLNSQVVATGVEKNVNYVDIRCFGIAAGSGFGIASEATTQIVASSGQRWTSSLFLKIVASVNLPNAISAAFTERTAGGGFVLTQVAPANVDGEIRRFEVNGAALQPTTERVQPFVSFALTNGVAYDFTIRVGLPQMENSEVATSVIKTSGSIQSRGADVISKGALTSHLGQSEGTIIANVFLRTNTTARRVVSISDGTSANRIGFTMTTMNVRVLKDANVNLISSASQLSGIHKMAIAYNSSEVVFAMDGQIIGTAAVSGAGTYSRIDVGQTEASASQFDDFIQSVLVLKSKLSNQEIISATTL